MADLHVLYETNRRDPVAELREIASDIEAGKYGEVGCLGLVVLGNGMHVFGAGIESHPCAIGMLLHAGFLRMSKAIEEAPNV